MSYAHAANQRSIDAVWGELSACDHCVQFYEDSESFVNTLEGFVAGGIRSGDAIVVIATPAHRRALEQRLRDNGFNLAAAIANDQYIALDAAETLALLMVDGWPDDALFAATVSGILQRARSNARKVRAFGEMVALLWEQGHYGATVRLEHLWNELCKKEALALFCAYPKAGFPQDAADSVSQLCAAHTKVIAAAA